MKVAILIIGLTFFSGWVMAQSAPSLASIKVEALRLQFSEHKARLTTHEIQRSFANVRDDALVQDSLSTTAVNYWYADGRFENTWSNIEGSGSVTGTWRAANDLRCVLILTGLGDRNGQEACSPVYQLNHYLISINADQSIHGIHTLSPMVIDGTNPYP